MNELLERLFPICRSLTGNGVRETLDVVGERIELERTEVPTGTQIYDWTVPREWNITGAFLEGPEGRVCDFADSNLHVLGYSVPVDRRLSLEELRPHLFSDPERQDVIPYRTSYHNENWGFCLPHRQLERLPEGEYHAVIDSTLEDGHLTYAEHVLPGETEDEVLLSTYVCHPSLANDNLSGIVLLTELAARLAGGKRRYTHRFLFSPATLGPLAWLSRNEERLGRVRHGLVACCVGDPGPLTYKRSRRGTAEIDRVAGLVVRSRGGSVRDWSPLGGDERQFGSPGFDLPVGVLSRTPQDEFAGYHSSADDLELIRREHMEDALEAYIDVLDGLEHGIPGNATYRSTNPMGEPQLGRRGLYRAIGGGSFTEAPLLWVLNLSDGEHDLVAIADRSGLPFAGVRAAADALLEQGLLEPVGPP
jgi:aminopeptidase-like protein